MLDADLQSFIRGSIPSTWALELLLLLRKHAPRPFPPEQLVLELRATPLLVSGCIEQLQKAGLVACEAEGTCRFAPASPALEQLCDQLARTYAERPVAVINTIMATPHDRLRSFADAFRFTKKED